MKVLIVRPGRKRRMYDGKYANLKRTEYIIGSRKAWQIKPGHITMINKALVANATPLHFKTYLRKAYKGEFLLIDETKFYWIIKRKDNGTEALQEDSDLRERYYHIPKRKARNSQVGGE